MPLGWNDLKTVLKLPDTYDADYLRKWQTADGVGFDQVMGSVGAGLLAFNQSLTSGYWSQYVRPTTELQTEYGVGQSLSLKKMTESGKPDPISGDITGHMLPLDDFGGALGWTYLALRRAKRSAIDRDIEVLMERGFNTWEQRVMNRLFSSAVETVGGTGKSVPFADGGTADANYIPISYGGKNFASNHNHFDRNTVDATGRTTFLKNAATGLIEHGQMGPFDLVISENDIASWSAQTEWRKPVRDALLTAGVETRSIVSEEYAGLLETDRAVFRVKVSPRLPTAYAGAFKPTGFNTSNAPLAVRYEEGYPLGLSIVGQTINYPFQDAVAMFTFGVGVNNRIGGYCGYFAASGSYVNPTIT